jgi:RNA polymerase sigma-70 factor (TIGR02960 family)
MNFDPRRVPIHMHEEQAFSELVNTYRRELQLHCYRMLGSLQDAEDAAQETLVSAWRGLEGFQEKSSVRTWLYRIATNRCLNVIRDRRRRPSGGLPFVPPPPTRTDEVTWLEPYPDDLLPDTEPEPESRYELKEAVGLAFITTLQRLPAAQRTVLVLRDVLGFRSAEVADMLDTTEATVNSALQRARSALTARTPAARERAPVPDSPEERKLADEFADAFELGDMDRVVSLLSEDAWVTMPPEPLEYQGHAAIAEFLAHGKAFRPPGARVRLLPTRANAAPAFGHYMEQQAGNSIARGLGVFALVLEGHRIARLTRFGSAELLPRFGLPLELRLD